MKTRCARIRRIALLSLLAVAMRAEEASERARRIEDQLLAPCCYSEALSVHRSELAARLRAEVRHAVDQGRSDREILDEYKGRYGLRILREPEGERRVWLHAGVVAGVLLGTLILVFAVRRLKRPVAEVTSPAADRPPPPEEELW